MDTRIFLCWLMAAYCAVCCWGLAQMPKEAEKYYQQGLKLYSQKNYDGAKKAWFECKKLLPSKPEYNGFVADIQFNLGRIEYMRSNFQRAKELWMECRNMIESNYRQDPGNAKNKEAIVGLYNCLANVWIKLGKPEKGKKYLEDAKRIASIVASPPETSSSSPSPTTPTTPIGTTSPAIPTSPTIQLSLQIEQDGKWVSWQQKAGAFQAKEPMKLMVQSACYVYPYRIQNGKCEFIPNLTITPEQFYKDSLVIPLDWAKLAPPTSSVRTFIVWYCCPNKLPNSAEFAKDVYSMTSSNLAFRGIEDEEEEEEAPKPIEYQMQQQICMAYIMETPKHRPSPQLLSELKILHTPLQIDMFLESQEKALQSNDLLQGGQKFYLRVINCDYRPLYLYVFHGDENAKVTPLLPRKDMADVCLQTSEMVNIKPKNKDYYTLDNNPGYEYTFFFFREQPVNSQHLLQTVQALLANKPALKAFIPGEQGNYLAFRNFANVADEEPSTPTNIQVDSEQFRKTMKDVIVLKFYKKAK